MDSPALITHVKNLLLVACVLTGLLAGENLFRYVMEVPGWRHNDISQWGEYSRNADLKGGIFIFPFEAVIGTLLLIIISVIILRKKRIFIPVASWIYLSTLLAILGLGLTFFAAPYMLSVRNVPDDHVLLQQTFDHFHFWGLLRAIAQILSFFVLVKGIGKLYEIRNN
jgi:hypothetical protein